MIKEDILIKVPAGIRYLGTWNEFRLSNFPNQCIIDKQLPGCGFTEYCLNGPEPVILCSPRIMLINNKADQHNNVYLVVNEMDKDPGVDKDLNKTPKEGGGLKFINTNEQKEKEIQIKEQRSRAFNKIRKELITYMSDMDAINKPMKILVTYDSYHIVKDILDEFCRFNEFYTIVDEFQSILHDSRFKSSTEMQFLENLRNVNRIMFASATPMMRDYINELEEFDGLPFYTLDWVSEDQTRVIKPNLDVYLMRSVGETLCKVARTYLEGNFESVIVQRDGKPTKVTSTEAVFYVNSVNHITASIKKLGLKSDQVLILCSNTEENKRKIRSRLGKDFEIGHVPNPNKGEKFPMFTFCTRTVYLGADFYSICARSFIFSDANVDSLAVDISEDLPQILGRQRLDENPWKNSATFYYRTTANYRKMTQEDFNKLLEKKKRNTENLLKGYNESNDNSVKFSLAEAYQKLAKSYNYKDDYVGVNKIYLKNNDTGEIVTILKPKLNNLVLINEKRAFNIQQIDYKDRFTVFAKLNNKLDTNDILNQEVELFFNNYDQLTTKKAKLKLLCECGLSSSVVDRIINQIPESDEIRSFYVTLGPKRLYELGYNSTKIERELGIVTFSEQLLENEIYKNFKVGDKLLLSDIKEKLANIYSSINYIATPKASDLSNYFIVKPITITIIENGNKKRSNGYELLLVKS